MGDSSVFDSLVAGISASERSELLSRLREACPVSSEPLIPAASLPQHPKAKVAERIAALGLLARLLLFFRRLFSGRSLEELFMDDELQRIAHEVGRMAPGLIDPRGKLLLEPFRDRLIALRDSARFFYDLLDRTVEKEKASFFAILASIEMPDIHADLLSETDPAALAAATEATEPELRSRLLRSQEEILASIPEDRRKRMYGDLRGVLFLKRLSGFLFDRLLGCYRPGIGPGGSLAAPMEDARNLLLELGDILFSLAEPPSNELMEALLLFAKREDLAKPEYDAEPALRDDFGKANAALGRIRSFMATVPLGRILLLAAEDAEYEPHVLPGGEDWFTLYRSFWKERLERHLELWRQERQIRDVQSQIAAFIGDSGPCSLAWVSREGVDGGPPVRQELALAFLDGFYRGTFIKELNRPLKILLVDGEFYRKDNRVEFTDAYNGILRLRENLFALDSMLKPEGEFGKAWRQAKLELAAAVHVRRRFQIVEHGVDDEAEKIIRGAGEAFKGMVRVIRGILKGEAGGRYDSLANLSSLDGRANKEFVASLSMVKDRCERALNLLGLISGLDLGRAD